MIVDELIAILGYETRGEAELRRFQRSLDGAARGISAIGVAAGTFIGTIAANAFTRLADSIGSLPGDVISTNAAFESYQATLETIEGSAEKARQSLDWVAEFAKTTPYEVGGVTEAFVRLKAYGLDPMDGTMSSIGDAASAMGKGLMQGVEAVADAATGEFERLKEFGIKSKVAGDQVTFTWSQNGKELSKTVKKSSTEIVKFLRDNFGARFNGAMLRQSKTWDGMMSNLGDSWTDFKRRIGDAGFFDAVKGQLGKALDYVGRLDADGSLDRWAGRLSRAFIAVSDFLGNAAVRIGRHIGTVIGIFDDLSAALERNEGLLNTIKAVLLGLAIATFPVASAFVLAALAVDDLLTYLRGGDSVIGDFIQWLADMRDALEKWVTELPGRIKDGIISAFQQAFDGAKAVVQEFVDWVTEKLSALNPLSVLDGGGPAVPVGVSGAGAAVPGSGQGLSYTGDALDYKTMLQNLEGNRIRMEGQGAAVESTVNDSRNQSVTVQVGGVTVNGAQNPTGAAGAAVGNAVGNAAAGAARRATWHEQGEKF